MTTVTDKAEGLTVEQTRQALAEHLRSHGVGADERWDVETLRALHDLCR